LAALPAIGVQPIFTRFKIGALIFEFICLKKFFSAHLAQVPSPLFALNACLPAPAFFMKKRTKSRIRL